MKHQGSTGSPSAIPSPKKMKFCPPTSSSGSSDVVSFGWNDFPVLLGHNGWDAFPLHVHVGQSPSFDTHEESPKKTLAVCHCAFHKSPTSAIVDNSMQNNCLAHIIETSDSEEDIDVDVDKNPTDTAPSSKLLKNQVFTTNTSTTQTQARITKRVQFTIIEVREHAVTLGDHPLAESYPISLDWAHAPVQVMRVDDYEAKRVVRPLNHYNRSPRARRMTRLERRVRLEQVMEVSPSALEDQEGFRCLAMQRQRSSVLTGDSPSLDSDLVNSLLNSHPSVANLGDDLLEMSLL
jgi:hypothetical protein